MNIRTVNDIFANDSAIRMMASSCLTVTGTGGASVSSRVDELRACQIKHEEGGKGGAKDQMEVIERGKNKAERYLILTSPRIST